MGTTVKEFADDDATVVVGTVIDPDMRDELRVTVVATGLGGSSKEAARPEPVAVKPVKVVGGEALAPAETAEGYRPLDVPTAIRRNPQAARAYVEAAENKDMDYLDIPAFLRRQAD